MKTAHSIAKTLANTVIHNETGREGILIERSDSYNPSAPWMQGWSGLVLWDGWMGTEWVKPWEMTIVADLVAPILKKEYQNATQSHQSRMGRSGDDYGRYGEKYYERHVKAFELALRMVTE